MSELELDAIELTNGVQHLRVSQLDAKNHKPEYLELRTVDSTSRDVSYLLGKIECLDKPFEDADVAADKVELWICSCPDFHFNQSDGVETGDRKPSEINKCKHIRKEVKHIKAQADDHQRRLDE